MSKKHVSEMNNVEYASAKAALTRGEPKPAPLPRDKPAPSAVATMDASAYAAAKREMLK